MGNGIPIYITRTLRRAAPTPQVTHGTVPVLSFGDPRRAKVATLGINPSAQEFIQDGTFLTGPARRLATLESLNAQNPARLNKNQIRCVIDDCARYFQRNPYRRWFDPLDKLLRVGIGVSYYDGTACHLDLVQWATFPTWGGLPDGVRETLLADGLPHLRAQLKYGKARLLLLNGRTVVEQVEDSGLVRLSPAGTLPAGKSTCALFYGEDKGKRFVGWSTNLQSSRGVTLEFRLKLAHWIADIARTGVPIMPSNRGIISHDRASAIEPSVDFDSDGYLPYALKVPGKDTLFRLLRQWLASSTRSTIGDVGTFGRRACLLISLDNGVAAVLNSDTKRAAVREYVDYALEHGVEAAWTVIANRNGRLNKLVFREDTMATGGWYCYLVEPLPLGERI